MNLFRLNYPVKYFLQKIRMCSRSASANFVDVRDISSEDKVKLKLKICPTSLPDLNPRVFSFERNKNESATNFRQRLSDSMHHKFLKKYGRKLKQKDIDVNSLPKIDVLFLDVDNKEIDYDNTTISNLLKIGNSISIDSQIFEIRYNVPTIHHCRLPQELLCEFPIFPHVEFEFCKLRDCKFDWFVHPDRENMPPVSSKSWQLIFRGLPFVPDSSRENHWIMLKISPPDYNGTPCEPHFTMSNSKLKSGPIQSSINNRVRLIPKPVQEDCVRVLSYNILADVYTDSDYSRNVLFPYCPPQYLLGSYRQPLVLKEVLAYNADIICLQEVDSSFFGNCLDPVLENLGYLGFFNPKALSPEGQATFFSNRFEVIRNCSLKTFTSNFYNLERLQFLKTKLAMNDALFTTWTKLGQSAGVFLVKDNSLPNSRLIIVVNTHLYFSPEANDLRLLQIITIMEHIHQLTVEIINEYHQDPLVLILADLNSNERSSVYQFLSTGKINANDFESLNLDSQLGSSPLLNLNYRSLQSAYTHTNPQFTNYTPNFHSVLDHIFFDPCLAEIYSLVSLPSLEEVTEKVALPNEDFPSDHLSLIVDLKYVK